MREKSNEIERCLGDDGDVIMVIGEEFNLSSTRCLQCGSNEVLQCIVLSEIILTLLCHMLRIIGNRKEIIELRSGFRFEGETSECLHSGLHRILDVENGLLITHRVHLGGTGGRNCFVILQRTIDGFAYSILLTVLNEVEMDEYHQQKSNVPIVELNHVNHSLFKNSLTVLSILRLFVDETLPLLRTTFRFLDSRSKQLFYLDCFGI